MATGYDEFKTYAFATLIAGGNPQGHLALGVSSQFSGVHYQYEDRRYFYSETTGRGWKIGDIPNQYQSVSVKMYQIPTVKR